MNNGMTLGLPTIGTENTGWAHKTERRKREVWSAEGATIEAP